MARKATAGQISECMRIKQACAVACDAIRSKLMTADETRTHTQVLAMLAEIEALEGAESDAIEAVLQGTRW